MLKTYQVCDSLQTYKRLPESLIQLNAEFHWMKQLQGWTRWKAVELRPKMRRGRTLKSSV